MPCFAAASRSPAPPLRCHAMPLLRRPSHSRCLAKLRVALASLSDAIPWPSSAPLRLCLALPSPRIAYQSAALRSVALPLRWAAVSCLAVAEHFGAIQCPRPGPLCLAAALRSLRCHCTTLLDHAIALPRFALLCIAAAVPSMLRLAAAVPCFAPPRHCCASIAMPPRRRAPPCHAPAGRFSAAPLLLKALQSHRCSLVCIAIAQRPVA